MHLKRRIEALERQHQGEVKLSEEDRRALLNALKRLFFYERNPDGYLSDPDSISDDDPEFTAWLARREESQQRRQKQM